MAEFKFGSAMPEYGWLEGFYDFASLKLKTKVEGKAIYEDKNGDSIVLTGSNLKYDGNEIIGGKVKAVQFENDNGDSLLSVTGGNFNAANLTDTLEKKGSFFDFLSALTSGNDRFVGNDNGTDFNIGVNHGNDVIIAGDAGSYMAGSQGNDTMKGGKGWDTLSYEDTRYQDDATKGVVIDAAKGTATDSWGGKDKFSGFEELRGTAFKDNITGSNGDDAFMGFKGADVIDGGKGEDELRYYSEVRYGGNDGIAVNLLKGTIIDGFGDKDKVSGIEKVYGTAKADTFVGDNGDNNFIGLAGKDSYDGGKGTDAVGFQFWDDLKQHGVTVDLSKAKDQIIDDGFNNKETTKSIEAVDGSQFDDKITLGDGGWVWGADGDDRLIAGTGMQWFGGGGGKDTFVFGSVKSMSVDKDFDQIDDFSQGDGDLIDLSGIKGLKFEGTGDFDGGKEVRYVIDGAKTYIYGDSDGDKDVDFQLELNGKINLDKADFIL